MSSTGPAKEKDGPADGNRKGKGKATSGGSAVHNPVKKKSDKKTKKHSPKQQPVDAFVRLETNPYKSEHVKTMLSLVYGHNKPSMPQSAAHNLPEDLVRSLETPPEGARIFPFAEICIPSGAFRKSLMRYETPMHELVKANIYAACEAAEWDLLTAYLVRCRDGPKGNYHGVAGSWITVKGKDPPITAIANSVRMSQIGT